MAMRKLNKKQVRNIQRHRGTYYVTIPISIIREFKWKEKQKVEVEKYGQSKILIKDWKK